MGIISWLMGRQNKSPWTRVFTITNSPVGCSCVLISPRVSQSAVPNDGIQLSIKSFMFSFPTFHVLWVMYFDTIICIWCLLAFLSS